jgi:hypothetical protein
MKCKVAKKNFPLTYSVSYKSIKSASYEGKIPFAIISAITFTKNRIKFFTLLRIIFGHSRVWSKYIN